MATGKKGFGRGGRSVGRGVSPEAVDERPEPRPEGEAQLQLRNGEDGSKDDASVVVAEGAAVLGVNGYSQQTKQLLDLLIKEGVDADKLEIVGAINKMLNATDDDGEPNFEVMERGIQLAQQLKDSVHGKHLKIVEKAADHQVRLLEVQNKKAGHGGRDPLAFGFTGLDGEG